MLAAVIMVSSIILSPISQVIAAGREAWQPAPRPVRSQWCVEHIKIPSQTGAQPGSFDLAHGHPYIREILDAVDDPDIRRITFIACTQIGKTEAVKAIALSQGEVDRAPMMFAGPDQVYTREHRRVIYMTAEASPTLSRRIPPERLRNDLWIDLQKSLVYLAWSGSSQRLSGRACKVVLCSEVDRWQNSPTLAEERTKAFSANSTVIFEGTPVDHSPYLEDYYKQSDRRTFHVPCPQCGHWQALRFFPHRKGPYAGRGGVGGLKDERGNWRSPEQARLAAYYICERGCRIEEEDRMEMIRLGRWVRDGQRIDAGGTLCGTAKNPCRHAGYRLNSLYSSTITFGDAAEKYLGIRDSQEGLSRFFNDWLGLGFTARGRTPSWKDLGQRLAGPVPRGVIPRAAYFLVAAADVQERGVYWSVRAFGDRKTSWLVDFGYLAKQLRLGIGEDDQAEEQIASDLAQLDEAVLSRRWPVDGQNARGLSHLAVRLLGVDRGYRATDVDAFIRAHPGTRVTAVYGDPKITPGTLYRPMKTERSARDGRLVPVEDPRTWGIETGAYKSEISDRWFADRTQPGVWWLPSDILETDGGEDYLRQITAESRRFELLNGRKVVRWLLISKGAPNHYFDTEVYSACLADMIVGNCWEAAEWAVPQRVAAARDEHEHAAREAPADDFSAR